jgi:anti-sigma factor RsiW
MTRPVEEFEVSALIDGELDPTRAAEVRAAIEQDPALHAQFLRLSEADRAWAGAAKLAQFRPAVAWEIASPSPGSAHAWVVTALALTMVLGRVIPKVLAVDLEAAMLIHGLILAGVITVVVWISGRAVPQGDSHVATSL